MGTNYSTLELKEIIYKDLKIDLAFPFFPQGRRTGSSACCVVDTEWIDKINNGDQEPIVLKNPGYYRNVIDGQKQSPTINIYVTVIPKKSIKNLSLYESTTETTTNKEVECWPFIHYIQSLLEGKGADQKIETLNDDFSTYDKIADLPEHEFVKRAQSMLWPHCKWFQKMSYSTTVQEKVNDQEQCIIIQQRPLDTNSSTSTDASNSNLPDVFALIETDQNYHFLSSYCGTTLQDLITYNPGVLSSNLKKSFITYQLLRIIASLHSRGILHGAVKASNILVDENLWVQLAGIEFAPNVMDFDLTKWMYDYHMLNMTKEIPQEPLVVSWIKGEISNYSYLMALNFLAGRREGDPNFYPILPWITDFSGDAIEDGWRNFKQTKFRINKGDEQLDFTFDGPVPHHITDILSDITYYVYQARITPIPVLSQFVRSKYEPNEYPSSMQRLYQWTPDECIPEFYTDPTIFKSIHPDMPDIQMPKWANSPEDFIRKHSEALESEYVSANLHHWIDLTFGSDLTGKGAIEAKNVALPLLAGQNSFMKHGIIQLFKDKHPQRGCNWNKTKNDIKTVVYEEEIKSEKPITVQTTIKSHKTNSIRTRQTVLSNSTSIESATTGLLSHFGSGSSAIIPSSLPSNRDRTPSIHSTASSIDTSRSLPSSLTADLIQSSLRTDPIRLPNYVDEDFFIDDLDHFEDMMQFATKYQSIMDRAKSELVENPVYPNPSQRFNIDPTTKTDKTCNAFSVGAAYDMYSLGQVIEAIYTAGNSKIVDSNYEPSQVPASGYFEMGNGELSYDIAPTGTMEVPPAVISVIEALTSEEWQHRPTAKAILCASFPAMAVRDSRCSFPFPDTVPEMHEYLAAFHQAEWSRRLYLADKWIDRICELEDEAFFLLLPSFSQLFTHVETRIGSISLFPKLAQRLGPERARRHLLKRIISLFEAFRPNIPKVLFSHKTIYEFVKRLDSSVFLQQMLPCYLEALATHDSSNVMASEFAGDAMAYICQMLGPILTSKHIVRQLVKIILRDNQVRSPLIKTTVRIIGGFGSTFTAVQYAYLISLMDTYRKSTNMTIKNAKTICLILTLLQDLIPYMSNEALVTELKSGFISTLYQLLEPFPQKQTNNTKPLSADQMKLGLSVSMKTIDFLLKASQKLTLQEWESTIISTLQKYFSGFTVNTTSEEEMPINNTFTTQRSYQMIYAYHKFCTIMSIEKIRRLIPTSDAIENMMFNQFASNNPHVVSNEATIPTVSVSSSRVDLSFKKSVPPMISPTRSDTTSASKQNNSAGSKLMSWMIPNAKKPVENDASSISSKKSSSSHKLSVDDLVVKCKNDFQLVDTQMLYESATRDLHAFGLPFTAQEEQEEVKEDTSSKPFDVLSDKSVEKDSKPKVPMSVLPWKTKWKPSAEDKKNWNRFLSTNSEEMSKSMQFSFNDLKLRGFAGHNASIRTLAVNEPAKIFASGSRDKTVKIWSLNVHQGIENWETDPYSESLVTYSGHRRGTINDVHFLATAGLNDIVASCDGQVHLWDPETSTNLYQSTVTRSSIVVSLKPVFQSRYLVGGTIEGNIMFFDAHNHTNLHTWKTSSMINGVIRIVAVNPSETLIAVGFSTGAISLLESRTGTLVASWKGGDTEITSMKFYTDDILLSCAPADHLICCWNVNRLALVKTISTTQDVISFDIYKDEILTINTNNSVSFIPINDDFQAYSSKFKPSIIKSQVSSFSIIPTDQLLLFGCAEGEIFLYA